MKNVVNPEDFQDKVIERLKQAIDLTKTQIAEIIEAMAKEDELREQHPDWFVDYLLANANAAIKRLERRLQILEEKLAEITNIGFIQL